MSDTESKRDMPNPAYLVIAGEGEQEATFKMMTLEVAVTTAISQSRHLGQARIVNRQMELVAGYRAGEEVV